MSAVRPTARARRPRASRSAPRSGRARRRPRRSRPRRASGSGRRPRPRTPCRPRAGAERALDLLRRVGDLAARIGVLDPQEALAAPPTGEQPVEQERAHTTDVQEPRGARRHADADAHAVIVDGAPTRPTRHTDGISSMQEFRTRIAPAASQAVSETPIPAASSPAPTKPRGVSTNDPRASYEL